MTAKGLARLAGSIASLALAMPAFADDQCLAKAVGGAGENAALHGQIVVSTRSRDGVHDTQVLRGSQAPESPLTGREGFRIASITKTYVAATVLRLWEDGKIDLDSPIGKYLPSDWLELLARDGYEPDRMTVRQLLGHTSGLADHAQAPQFIATIKADPQTTWTREADVRHLVDWTQPVGKPGEKFAYSDTGYVLLGAIVERVTGETLPKAVRAELALDKLGVPDTYWEQYEPANGRVRAHQWFEGLDTYTWSPTMDLYGGGGLVATPRDLTTFLSALLEGKVFHKAETLALMESSKGLPADSPYRLGVFAYDFDGVAAIGHSGFWGTLVATEPVSGRTIAGAVTDRSDYPRLKSIVTAYVHQAAAQGAKPCDGRPSQ
ncbi:MAG TPA: serine hydrolase domain-containing protein [Lysobacter sp.]